MGFDSVKDISEMCFQARKEASKWDSRLASREGAAGMLGISSYTLADYELGNVKVIPVDKIVLMADLYNCPELKNRYCKCECPIGKRFPIAVDARGIEGITLRLIRRFDPDTLRQIQKDLVEITEDGIISEDETERLGEILKQLDDLVLAVSELKLAGRKATKAMRRADGRSRNEEDPQ